MKKIFLTSCLLAIIACPSFANIDKDASTATCDNATIGTTTGPANLQADWTANTIHLDWYSNDTKQTSTTCTYDDGITLPSTPTVPTGYTFGGWKVRLPFDLSTYNYSNLIDAVATDFSVNDEPALAAKYGLTPYGGEWALESTDGTVKGVASCNDEAGINHDNQWGGDITDWSRPATAFGQSNTGRQCWCKVIGYSKQNGNYTDYVSVTPNRWVFLGAYDTPAGCLNSCTTFCVGRLLPQYPKYYMAAWSSALFNKTN